MKRFGPLKMLIASIAMVSAVQVAYVATGTTPSGAVAQLTSSGLALAFILWVMEDARRGRQTPCFDFGFIVAVYFPVSLLWYVLWTRGWRGMFTLAFLLGLMLLPGLSAVVAWIFRYRLA